MHSILSTAKNKYAGSTRISEGKTLAKEQLEWRLTSGVLIYLVDLVDLVNSDDEKATFEKKKCTHTPP